MYRTVVEESPKNMAIMDVFSRLVQERIIFIDDVIDSDLANGVIAQMLYLDSKSTEPINVYINSPGGNVYDGLAIYDVSKLLKSRVNTVCIGLAASMGALLMLMGKERSATKHSRIMFHSPSNQITGKIEEIKIDYEQTVEVKEEMYKIIKDNTNIQEDIEELFKFDTWYNSQKALESGILTKIL